MSEIDPQPESLGPPAKSSVDWYFTPRPGRQLDAARVKLATEEVREFKPPWSGYWKFLPGAILARVSAGVQFATQALLAAVRG